MLLTVIAGPLVFAATALAQTFSIATPAQLIQCQPAQITWTGGSQPFILSAIPAGQVSAPAIAGIATGLTSSPYTWNVNLPSGVNLTLRLSDSSGAIAYSSPVVIFAGVSNSCLNASASTSGLATVSVSTVTSGLVSTTSSASSTTSMSGSTTSAASSTSMSATSAAATTTSKAWAMPSAVVAVPAIAMAAFGGVVALL